MLSRLPLPSCWRPAIVVPIHGPGGPASSPYSFRPVSLASCISRLFERLILSRLTFHLGSSRLLSACQAGFCPGGSSLGQILALSRSVWDGFRRGGSLRAEPFWHLLASPGLSTRSGTLLCFTGFSRLGSPLALFFGCALSFLGSGLVLPAAVSSASGGRSPWARCLVQSSSSCLLMASSGICLRVPVPPCVLAVWPFGPPPRACSVPLLLSGPPSLS